MKIDWVIPAAGQGKRMGAGKNKLLIQVAGRSLFYHTLNHLCQLGCEGLLVVPCQPKEQPALAKEVRSLDFGQLKLIWAEGGQERPDSVRCGLKLIQAQGQAPVVMVHDAARPFLTLKLVQQLIKKLAHFAVTVPGVKVTQTTRRQLRGTTEVVDREGLYLIQTPQAFETHQIKPVFFSTAALTQPLNDEASYFEQAGLTVGITPGEPRNLKLTTLEDLDLAQAYLTHFSPLTG